MSTEFISGVGISDPTLSWVEQADVLRQAPGIDPTEALQGNAEMVPDAGYLVVSTVYLGTGLASTRLHMFDKGELRLCDQEVSEEKDGLRRATAEFSRPGMYVDVVCGNASDRLPDDEPGFAAVTSGEAKVTTNKWNGFFVAETDPSTLSADRLSVKSYNPNPSHGRYREGHEEPVHLLRVVGNLQDALAIATAVGQGAGLDELQQDFYTTKVNEKLTSLKWAIFDRNEAERQPVERGRFATYVVGVLQRRLGIHLADKA